MIEKTLVLLKPDAVQRALIGDIISRFEKVGFKIVGMKLHWADNSLAKKHYTDDIAKRRGEKVRQKLLDFITQGPVVAIALEGVNAIEIVRKMVGDTEPKKASPGTIKGDYAHVSYHYADGKEIAVKNIIHASSNKEDAEYELKLWFSDKELYNYKNVHDFHIF